MVKKRHFYFTLCRGMAQWTCTFATENKGRLKKNNIMKSTEYDIQKLAAMISSDSSFTALVEMMGDMGLEITGIEKQC